MISYLVTLNKYSLVQVTTKDMKNIEEKIGP